MTSNFKGQTESMLGQMSSRCHGAQLVIIRQMSRQVSHGSAGEYQADEPPDTCLLICLILASGAARHLPAHLPDTRQLSRVPPACSSA